jgi:hypothetical protein
LETDETIGCVFGNFDGWLGSCRYEIPAQSKYDIKPNIHRTAVFVDNETGGENFFAVAATKSQVATQVSKNRRQVRLSVVPPVLNTKLIPTSSFPHQNVTSPLTSTKRRYFSQFKIALLFFLCCFYLPYNSLTSISKKKRRKMMALPGSSTTHFSPCR